MHRQFAVSTFPATFTVGEGVLAPGHLGELTKYVPFELVDAVLEETGTVERRRRILPSRVGVYFVLALGLFPHLGYAKVWSKLVAGLPGFLVVTPSEKALRDLRRRLGATPLKALFEVVAGPLAQPRTPGVRYRRWRTVAFDGCSSIKVPDGERNYAWLGRVRHRLGIVGYPTLRLMSLVETGTRGLLGAAFGPKRHGENHYARQLLHLLNEDFLVLADRGFDDGKFLGEVADTGAQFLVRLSSTRRLPTQDRLPDGSYLTRIRHVAVRVIDAEITASCADGSTVRDGYRLVTTLLDASLDPAERLVRLYHERWEIESAYYALRHTLLQGHVLRSGDQVGLEQEMWALLTLYQLLRTAMIDAVESRAGTDPDRASFTVALEAARDQILIAPTTLNEDPLVGRIGQAILPQLLPARRMRISARRVKCPLSRYGYAIPTERRPLSSSRVGSLVIAIHSTRPTTPAFLSHRHPSQTPLPPPNPSEPSLLDRAFAVLRSEPGRRWGPRELAKAVNADNVHSYAVLLARWARNGLIHKPQTGVYMLLDEAAPTAASPPPPPRTQGASQLQGTLAVLRSAPDYSWTPHEVAPALGITNVNSLNTQMAKWARKGLIYRTRRGAYAARPSHSLDHQPLTCLGAR
ncbi:IS4 family transposase [Streptomyces sp. NPDC048445]|uniref:IS4 family transposase n=1 Tax=Streptomyces sp. NPDC048445 TaxID=3365553 RepID=UPI00371A34AF